MANEAQESSTAKVIVKGEGSTETERILALLAERSFLQLWSYPNCYIDKKGHATGDGKELCDLLVVFGDDILIFSDKAIQWPTHEDINVNWKRWYKKAIQKSVEQIRGAERWLREHPDRIFLDKSCSTALPIDLPPVERRRVHGIAIVSGASEAARKFFKSSDGSLVILPKLKGQDHLDAPEERFRPFAVGDVDPNGPFVHVFDQDALRSIMLELDTARDFLRYINHRADAIRNESIIIAENETDLLGFYLTNEDEDGEHSFVDRNAPEGSAYALVGGLYDKLIARPEYQAKLEANRQSYAWDRLIDLFTETLLSGTMITHPDYEFRTNKAERALRIMAGEERTQRRMLAEAVLGALATTEAENRPRFARVSFPGRGANDQEAAYLFLVLAYPKNVELKEGYDQYRRFRLSVLETYAYSILMDNRHLKRVIGIAFDARGAGSSGIATSEDFMMLEVNEWTPEMIAEVERRKQFHDVLDEKRLVRRTVRVQEYPELPDAPKLSRQQRRAMERRTHKRRRSRS